MIVAVDLAPKFSGAIWLDEDGAIRGQWDSWQSTETEFIDVITAPFRSDHARPWVMVVEDLPHGVKYHTNTKTVCRLQGRIIERMDRYGVAQRLLFVPPIEWRKTYEGLERGTGPDAVVPVAAAHGYTPPDLTARIRNRGDRARIKKVATDYCASYLIGLWALNNMTAHGTFYVNGIESYEAGVTSA